MIQDKNYKQPTGLPVAPDRVATPATTPTTPIPSPYVPRNTTGTTGETPVSIMADKSAGNGTGTDVAQPNTSTPSSTASGSTPDTPLRKVAVYGDPSNPMRETGYKDPVTGNVISTAGSSAPTQRDTLGNLISATSQPAPTLESVTEQKKKEAQALVDSIRSSFSNELDSIRRSNAVTADRGRALNIAGRLGGSDFASANAEQIDRENQQKIDAKTAEMNAKIATIEAGISGDAMKTYQEQFKNYTDAQEKRLNYQGQVQALDKTKADSTLTALAAAGRSLDAFKTENPTGYENLLTLGGYTPLQLDFAYTQALPPELRPKFEDVIVPGEGGKAALMRYGYDPIKKTVVTSNYPLDADYNILKGTKPIETKDGELLLPQGDGTYKSISGPSALVRSQINENNASAYEKSTAAQKNLQTASEPKGAKYEFNQTQKAKLVKTNLSVSEINAIQDDLKTHSLQDVLAGISDANQKKAVEEAVTNPGTSSSDRGI